jgi:cytochrome P450
MTTATPTSQATPLEPSLEEAPRTVAAYQRRYTGTGPRGDLLMGAMREYGRNPLGAMVRWRDEHGDLVPIRFGPFRAHMAFGPREIEELLIERSGDYRKSVGTRMLTPLLGRGLLTAEGEDWLRHRRLAAPAFHRDRVATYGSVMARYAEDAADAWCDGEAVDVHEAMTSLTLRIVARVLFDADVTTRIAEVARLGTDIQDYYFDRYSSLRFLIPTWLPTPGNLRLARTIRRLDDVVYGIIDERSPDEDRGDLLSMLLLARDDHGGRLTRRQVRDEVMTLLLAGHETTAVALTWAFMLLSRHPAVRAALELELTEVLGGRVPTVSDVAALRYTEAVVYETLRLYPPAYATGREAIRATRLGDVRIPKRHIVFASMYVTHRDPRFFEEPETFRPERWLDGLEKRLPRGAFIPFGLGPRKCIGSSFAMLEATLLLAAIARRRRFDVTAQTIPLHPAVTLRPGSAVPAVIRAAA